MKNRWINDFTWIKKIKVMKYKSCGLIKFNHKHTLKKYLLEHKLLKLIQLAEEDINKLIDEYVNKTNNGY